MAFTSSSSSKGGISKEREDGFVPTTSTTRGKRYSQLMLSVQSTHGRKHTALGRESAIIRYALCMYIKAVTGFHLNTMLFLKEV